MDMLPGFAGSREDMVAGLPQGAGLQTALRAMSYIVSSLKDPLQPLTCAKSLAYGMTTIMANYLAFPEEQSYISKRDTLRATMYNFIAAKRTDQQLNNLIKNLSKCSCKNLPGEMASFHKLSIPANSAFSGKEVQQLLVSGLSEINLVINQTSDAVKKVQMGTAKTWPWSVKDLMPHGPDEIVRCILQWHRVTRHVSIPRWALHVVQICELKALYAPILKYDIAHHLFVNYTHDIIKSTIQSNPLNAKNLSLTSEAFCYQAITLIVYLHLILDFDPDDESVPLLSSVAGVDTKALQLCSILHYMTFSPFIDTGHTVSRDLPKVREESAALGRRIFRKYNMNYSPYSPVPLHPRIVELDLLTIPTGTHDMSSPEFYHKIALTMYTCRFVPARDCSAPNCPSSNKPGLKLRACAGCSTLRYCSKECQTRDWKEGRNPHKRVCKAMASIVASYGGWPHGPSVIKTAQKAEERRKTISEITGDIMAMTLTNQLTQQDCTALYQWAVENFEPKPQPSKPPFSFEEYRRSGVRSGYDDYADILTDLMSPTCKWKFNGPKRQSSLFH
ncbi:hypothetical protein CVT24_006244 [Panaeolus cyanescens]|uniref:MYND-type domain-containing protein n=1 Tax=Panaeolus cyanescens TaxID=181874 RepID=A0A409YEG5_9AGAR|nr:hypothetical protein CVT24_006244 [Panaeolus cyanescens]